MKSAEIEKRLSAMERQVAHLTKKLDKSAVPGDINGWIDQIHGTFQDDAAYRQARAPGVNGASPTGGTDPAHEKRRRNDSS